MDMFELHRKMTGHLFPAFASEDERFLALALCGEAGELANMIKKRWHDGADLTEEIRDEIADIRVYLELIAKCFGIEGDKLDQRVEQKLVKVVEKHKIRLGENPFMESGRLDSNPYRRNRGD
jgi:NTP pyrophosphatase (non-canonical NTP hydrolase)